MAQKSIKDVIIIGGGPTGLLIGSLLLDLNIPISVTIVEKRKEISRSRPVKLMGRILSSDEMVDEIFVFSENQIDERKKAIESMKLELFQKIVGWLEICTPIKDIQKQLRKYFVSSGGTILSGENYDFSQNLDLLQHYPDTLIIDCTGYHSVLQNHIQPDNRISKFIEYVIVWTFTINAPYECNELCKFYKNLNTQRYRVIPSVNDTYIDGDKKTHLTCLITIDKNIFDQLSTVKPLTFEYLSKNFEKIADDMHIFLNNLSCKDINKYPIGKMEFISLPLHVYRAKKTVNISNVDNLNQPWVLMGDAAMGGPYFQSISFGYEGAIYFAYIFKHMDGNVEQMLAKYEDYMEKLWLSIQFRSNVIQKNKEILQELCVENHEASRDAILKKLKIY